MQRLMPIRRRNENAAKPWDRTTLAARATRYAGRRVGLGGKLMLGYTAVLFIAVVGCVLAVRYETGRQFRGVAEESARQVSRTLAVALGEGIDDRATLHRLAEAAAADGGRVRVLRTDRRTLLAAAGPMWLPGHLTDRTYLPMLGVPETVEVGGGERAVLTRQALYQGRRLVGFVDVALPARERAFNKLAERAAVIGLSACLMGQLVVSFLVRRAVRPLEEVIDAAGRVAEGQTYSGMDTTRGDEIGDLARSFDEMACQVARQREDVERANAELAAMNRELEARIRQRTQQIESANGRLAAEIAEKEDFLRAVSHDLNAPLRNISGMVTMIQRRHGEQLGEDVARRLERVQQNVANETELIDELLELSRIKTKSKRFEDLEVVDVEALVWELRGMFENDLRERRIELTMASTLPRLRAEKARLRQLLQNLIDNAIKYMGEGSEGAMGLPVREIKVGCRVRVGEAEFFVSDTGKGIAPEEVDKVFYVFRRAKNHGDAPGKGVGLASVKSIVETFSGSIWVESELGRGSTFRFTVNAKHVVPNQVRAAA